MKTIANRLTMLAAGAVMLSTMAFGQASLKVEVPFAFRTSTATLPAGTYVVRRASVSLGRTVHLENSASRHGIFATAVIKDSAQTASPSVVFACQGGSCWLSSIRTSSGSYDYQRPRKTAAEQGEISFISLPLITRNGD